MLYIIAMSFSEEANTKVPTPSLGYPFRAARLSPGGGRKSQGGGYF